MPLCKKGCSSTENRSTQKCVDTQLSSKCQTVGCFSSDCQYATFSKDKQVQHVGRRRTRSNNRTVRDFYISVRFCVRKTRYKKRTKNGRLQSVVIGYLELRRATYALTREITHVCCRPRRLLFFHTHTYQPIQIRTQLPMSKVNNFK
jgi:hypothetical protein